MCGDAAREDVAEGSGGMEVLVGEGEDVGGVGEGREEGVGEGMAFSSAAAAEVGCFVAGAVGVVDDYGAFGGVVDGAEFGVGGLEILFLFRI